MAPYTDLYFHFKCLETNVCLPQMFLWRVSMVLKQLTMCRRRKGQTTHITQEKQSTVLRIMGLIIKSFILKCLLVEFPSSLSLDCKAFKKIKSKYLVWTKVWNKSSQIIFPTPLGCHKPATIISQNYSGMDCTLTI